MKFPPDIVALLKISILLKIEKHILSISVNDCGRNFKEISGSTCCSPLCVLIEYHNNIKGNSMA